MQDDIPFAVPDGWHPKRWAAYCRHMADASRGVRPDLSAQWAEAADLHEGKKKPPAGKPEVSVKPVGLEALLLGFQER